MRHQKMLPGCGYFLKHKMPPILFWLQIIKEKKSMQCCILYIMKLGIQTKEEINMRLPGSGLVMLEKSTLQLEFS